MGQVEKDFQEILGYGIDFSFLSGQRVVVTGATGLVGSLFLKFLNYLNHELELKIKMVAVVRNVEKAHNIFSGISNIEIVSADLAKDVLTIPGEIDYLLHTAAITQSKLLVEKPVEALKTALNGSQKVFDLSINKHTKKIIYLSSMEAYGEVTQENLRAEEDLGKIDLTQVRSGYPESKRMVELMALAFHEEYGIPVVSARLAQTFGAGILPSENRVFAQFAKSAIKGENITLRTPGKSFGNYVYTKDVLVALLILLMKGVPGTTYNVSNPDNHMMIKDMAQLVLNKFGNGQNKVVFDIPSEVTKLGYAPDTKLWLDNKRLRKLGWNPTVSVTESYERMINYLNEVSLSKSV